MGKHKLIITGIVGLIVIVLMIISARNNPTLDSELNTTSNTNSLTTTQAQLLSTSLVKEHSTQNNCWTIINNKVYDITKYIKIHPGGNVIVKACGIDGTELFATKDGENRDHSSSAKKILEKYLVGEIGSTLPTNSNNSLNQSILSETVQNALRKLNINNSDYQILFYNEGKVYTITYYQGNMTIREGNFILNSTTNLTTLIYTNTTT